jgi:hypothetical protein
VIGHGLRENRSWAIAASRLFAYFCVPLFPVGTIIGVYILGKLKKATPPKERPSSR